jgi:hypothetical protein
MANKATYGKERKLACMALDDPEDPGNLMNLGSDNPGSNPEPRALINSSS